MPAQPPARWPFLAAVAVLLTAAALVWGGHVCVRELNRALGGSPPVRAVRVERLDAERLAVDFLNTRLVLAVPEDPKPRWSPVGE